ncbi:MarR family winged helix-turn-helix transcriptional regulator [Spirochaeta cellobiosiphila]|uniref:MarR family winged helix-turn-helix transcriptional regulator n=1 Tax=Spirochaeta cellobiosiphila TaxID=504483 RepID=UPI00048DA2BA|nr:MarR family winged helix-turn-helix transcriptional regulator [Spirochaeta cellobiosiphila]
MDKITIKKKIFGPPENYLPRLIHELDKMVVFVQNIHLSNLNMSFLQLLIIVHLKINGENGVNQKNLEKTFGVTSPVITHSLKSMQKKGYISKEVNAADTRHFIIKLNDKGEEVFPQCSESLSKMEETFLKRLTPEELKDFIRLSYKLLGPDYDMTKF